MMLGLITAKHNSTGIPGKNYRVIAGKIFVIPLKLFMYWPCTL